MSTNLAFTYPQEFPGRPTSPGQPSPWDENPRKIEIVTSRSQRRARPKLAYALVAVGGLLVIFLGQLMLSIALSNGAYSISKLQVEQRNLGRVQSSLSEQLELAGSTQNLAANAQNLGMVANSSPAFLNVADGTVMGSAVAAKASAAGSGLIANSLLGGLPLAGDTAPAESSKPAASTGIDTETNTESAISTPTKSANTGAPAAGTSTASVPSTAGVLPSPITR